jgi:hypothetical protein
MFCARSGFATALAGAAVLSLDPSLGAQAVRFKARLTPVPVETSTVANITGTGSVTAALTGTTLSITGAFEGMKSPATLAQIHLGPKGIRGPAEFDLTVTKGPAGTINGTLTLTPVQVDSLRKGWFYIQIHSEKAPDGNLWGWLVPQG